MRIILASESEYRKHALNVLGLKYEVIPSDLDERNITEADSAMLAKKMSEAKAIKIGDKNPDSLIIAADLFVVFNSKILHKPKDETEAIEMLSSLSGKKFEIMTGLAVYNSHSKTILSTVEVCKVTFRKLTQYEIKDYVSRYPVLKCAAAFESDGLLRFAKSINGSYNFRAALPVDKLVLFLREQGMKV